MNKSNIMLYICIALFAAVGIYLTFFVGNVSKYDSSTHAYSIDINESRDIDDNTTYSPTYHFRVNGVEYACKSRGGSSSYPNKSKDLVYYDSADPTKCTTQYDKSSGTLGGVICLAAVGVMIYFFIFKKPSSTEVENEQVELTPEQQAIAEEKVKKAIDIIDKVQLIYKRVIIGIIIAILLVLILIDTAIFKQTLKAKDFIDTTATCTGEIVESEEDSIFDDYVYTFTDKNGVTQEITIGVSKDESPDEEVKIKYNENDPKDFYEENATLNKSGMIWYIVKIVAVILLVLLFFNKKLLSKIGISLSNRNMDD